MSRIDPDERQAFLEAIREAGDDPSAALIYADFLEENGEEERGQFIRDFCEWEGLPEWRPEKQTRGAKLRRRANRMGIAYWNGLSHGMVWRWQSLPAGMMASSQTLTRTEPACTLDLQSQSPIEAPDGELRFESFRGLDISQWREFPAEWIASAIRVRSLACQGRIDLGPFPAIGQLRNFRGHDWYRPGLLASLPFEELRSLTLYGGGAGDWHTAGYSPGMKHLRALELPSLELSSIPLLELATEESFPSLRTLSIAGFDALGEGRICPDDLLPSWMARLEAVTVRSMTAGQLLEASRVFGASLKSFCIRTLVVRTPEEAAIMMQFLARRPVEEFRVDSMTTDVSAFNFLLYPQPLARPRVLALPFTLTRMVADVLVRLTWSNLEYLQIGSRGDAEPSAVVTLAASAELANAVITVRCRNYGDQRFIEIAKRTAGRINFERQ